MINNECKCPFGQDWFDNQCNCLESSAIATVHMHATTPYSSKAHFIGSVEISHNDELVIEAAFAGLAPNSTYGLHIHKYGDISNLKDGSTVSTHFDPAMTGTHGCPNSTNIGKIHAGDLGIVTTDVTGGGSLSWTVPASLVNATLDPTSPYYIIGRGMSLHDVSPNACLNSTSLGSKIAVGVIGYNDNHEYVGGSTVLNAGSPQSAIAVILPDDKKHNGAKLNGTVSMYQNSSTGIVQAYINVSGFSKLVWANVNFPLTDTISIQADENGNMRKTVTLFGVSLYQGNSSYIVGSLMEMNFEGTQDDSVGIIGLRDPSLPQTYVNLIQ
jgi:Cu/Zn superoxide dismutase